METKFTKGEWNHNIIELEDFGIAAISNQSKIIAQCNLNGKLSEEVKANARLISAAPEMYEQLSSIIDGTAFDKETGLILAHRLEEIRKVLNKAVGSDFF